VFFIAGRKRTITHAKAVKALFLVGILCFIYLLDTFPYLRNAINDSFIYNYILKPFIWLILAYTAWRLPRSAPAASLRFRILLKQMAFVCAVFYIVFMVAGGLLDGFGKSPYSFTPLGILFNFILVGATLLGTELTRANLVNNLAVKRSFLSIAIISVFLTFINIPLLQILALEDAQKAVQMAGNQVLPLFSEQLMASYLAYLGGPVPAMFYMGTLQAFRWFCPILPNLAWVGKTLLGTLVPFVSLMVVQSIYEKQSWEFKRHRHSRESAFGWVVASVFSVCMVWFAAGLFPIYPQVIATGSMEPLIKPGDVILVKKINGQEAQIGDIIQYRLDEVYVAHRVVAVVKGKGELFQTKGDNNSSADSQYVEPGQIKGKVIHIVPKLGWPTLLLKSGGNQPPENLET